MRRDFDVKQINKLIEDRLNGEYSIIYETARMMFGEMKTKRVWEILWDEESHQRSWGMFWAIDKAVCNIIEGKTIGI